jgi:hypothetical protein
MSKKSTKSLKEKRADKRAAANGVTVERDTPGKAR